MTGFPILRLPTVQLDPVADFGPESVRRHSDVVQPRRQRGKDGITGAVRRHASCEVGLRIAPVVSVTTPVIWPCVCAVATGAIGKQVTSKTTALLSRLAPNMQPLWGASIHRNHRVIMLVSVLKGGYFQRKFEAANEGKLWR